MYLTTVYVYADCIGRQKAIDNTWGPSPNQWMNLDPVPPTIAEAGLRALKMVCLRDDRDRLSELQQQFLKAVQTHILQSNYDLEAIGPITPDELASVIPAGEFRDRIIRAMIITACVDGDVDGQEVEFIERTAQALNVDMAPVKTAWKLAHHQLMTARLDIIRRSLVGVKIGQTIRQEGLIATVKKFFPMMGVPDPELTKRYRGLGECAPGTLGRSYYEYILENNFFFPGEKGSAPEVITVHDCLHILGEYSTTPAGEIEVSSFQAGCQSQDPIYGLLFGLAQYHLGVQVAPVAAAQKMNADPARMIAAFSRGCRVKRDMWRDFNPWNFFARPLDDLRIEFGIAPK